jgi:DNA-binding transcriptional LysR family regulator
MLNLNQLRAFYQAAKHLSFTGASKELFITQPAVTAQVKSFEKHLGLKLFSKRSGKLHLTEEGKIIYAHARKIFESERQIQEAVEQIKKLERGTLKLGTARTYARYFVPFLIAKFRESHPRIKIHLDEGSSSDMIRSLGDLENEVAIIAQTGENPKICFVPLGREELILILAPEHPLAGEKAIPFQDIRDEPIIMKEVGSGTRRLVLDLFEKNGCEPRVLMETSDAEMIKLLVQHGEGVAFLVREAVVQDLRDGRLATVPIEGHRLFLDLSIAYLRNQTLSPPAQAFLASLRNLEAKDLRLEGVRELVSEATSQGS